MKANAKLEQQVAAIGDLSREELVAMWEKQYGCPPPKGVKRGLLERSAAWHLQARRLGGLSAAARRMLKAAERDHIARQDTQRAKAMLDHQDQPAPDAGEESRGLGPATTGPRASGSNERAPVPESASCSSARVTPIVLSPGTRLLREWNGRMYAVDVLDKGFVMDGRTYRSLSAIARRITGAGWSGRRFFGL